MPLLNLNLYPHARYHHPQSPPDSSHPSLCNLIAISLQTKKLLRSFRCDKCGQQLHDTIINFSEPLPSGTLHRAMEHSDRADLGLVLGTSMRVSPPADLPIRIVSALSLFGGKGFLLQKAP